MLRTGIVREAGTPVSNIINVAHRSVICLYVLKNQKNL